MCGEIDENILINQELLERFTVMSGMLGVKGTEPGGVSLPSLASSAGRSAYMQQIFGLGLTRALADATAAAEGEAVDAMASQAIAFARLAGFLAGQLPPDADLFRAVIDAVSSGHAETGALSRRYQDAQAEAHGHHHDHGDDDHHHH